MLLLGPPVAWVTIVCGTAGARGGGPPRPLRFANRIGVNEANRLTSRRAAPATSLEQQLIDPADTRPEPPGRLEQTDLRQALERAVRELPPDQRAPLVLRDIEGLSTAQAAAVLELGEAAFKSRLHRARLAVRDATRDYLPEDPAR